MKHVRRFKQFICSNLHLRFVGYHNATQSNKVNIKPMNMEVADMRKNIKTITGCILLFLSKWRYIIVYGTLSEKIAGGDTEVLG